MHAHETVELAAFAATHGRPLVRKSPHLSSSHLNEYWMASKCRIDRWSQALASYEREAEHPTDQRRQCGWPRLVPVLQEIMAGEALVRVWTAVVTAHDRRRNRRENQALVRSIFLGHQGARNRAMRHLLQRPPRVRWYRPSASDKTIAALEQCRRRTVRWTDLLVGYLIVEHDVAEFAFEPVRAEDFAHDIQRVERAGAGRLAWSLTLSSLQNAFRGSSVGPTPNADLNGRIATSILGCFEPEMVEPIGAFRSLWTMQLLGTANEAIGMVDELLQLDQRPVGTGEMPPIGHRLRSTRFG